MSYSSLASYLECPGCALERKKRSKELKHFTTVRQASLFGKSGPDPRLIGTLLHTLVNFLHDSSNLLAKERQEALLDDPHALAQFLRHDALALLQKAGKLRLAMLLDELSHDEAMFRTSLIAPMLRYQQELASTGAVVLSASARFQFKLLSTRNTFVNHPDWGGYVAIVGEFDQIRFRNIGSASFPAGVPSIMEFKKGLGGDKRSESTVTLFSELEEESEGTGKLANDTLPTVSHAMQLMIYWLAFQMQWDVLEKLAEAKGMVQDIYMPLHQQLDLIIYNLNDGCQYQLLPTDQQEALSALTNCIFYLNWAMKSGFALQSPEHDCKKTQLVEMPDCAIQVGYTTLSARECYLLAKNAFDRFKNTIRWKRVSHPEENHSF